MVIVKCVGRLEFGGKLSAREQPIPKCTNHKYYESGRGQEKSINCRKITN